MLSNGGQASAGPLLIYAEVLMCPRFAVLLQHSIRTLPVVKYIMFYSLPVSYISWDGGGKKRRQEIGFEPMRPKFYS